MPVYDWFCICCESYFEKSVSMEECAEKQDCEACGESGSARRAYIRAPMTRVGGEGSDRQISAMQKSFRQRFVKKELDDVRDKHGAAIDDSLRRGELDRRIKDKNEKKN